MNSLNRQPKLPQLLQRQLAAEPMMVIDVGCSGGVDEVWNVFGLNVQAIGFDPLIAEVERLRAQEKRPDFVYEAAFVGCHRYDELFPKALRDDKVKSRSNTSFARTSAARAMKAMQMNYVQQVFNQGAEVKMADRTVELDGYLADKNVAAVDFVKIDTDSHDLEVLLGAQDTLARRGVLGVEVECQCHGPAHPYANVFSNIDRLMRDAGFTLFGLDVWRYTRGVMPGAFTYDIAAQTVGGGVQFADALYLRDLGDPSYTEMTGYAPSAGRLAKLACLFEIYGLPDCAAELIVNHPHAFEPIGETLLDTLTPIKGGPGIYRRFLELFDSDPTRFYPSRLLAKKAS